MSDDVTHHPYNVKTRRVAHVFPRVEQWTPSVPRIRRRYFFARIVTGHFFPRLCNVWQRPVLSMRTQGPLTPQFSFDLRLADKTFWSFEPDSGFVRGGTEFFGLFVWMVVGELLCVFGRSDSLEGVLYNFREREQRFRISFYSLLDENIQRFGKKSFQHDHNCNVPFILPVIS